MNAPVVDDAGFHDIIAVCRQNPADRIAQKIIAQMAEVKRFVGVWRGKLNHHRSAPFVGNVPKAGSRGNVVQQRYPGSIGNTDVQKSLHYVERTDDRAVFE